MEVADKAVATDEIRYAPDEHNTCVEVARLQAVLNTLVEQKVHAMKTTGSSGSRFIKVVSAASPRTIAKRLRIASLSTSVGDRDLTVRASTYSKRKRRRRRQHHQRLRQLSAETDCGDEQVHKVSPESARCNLERMPLPLPACATATTTPPIAVIPPTPSRDGAVDEVYLQFDPTSTGSCCCVDHSTIPSPDTRIPISCNDDDDYVSLKIDECDEIDYEDDFEARRRRRKRRKLRRKRRKLRAMAAVAIVEDVRAIDPDELPPKARWTIVATAGILLFMCLMLVGVTLRMAPLIDDMVRKENEALMHSLHGNYSPPTATATPGL